MPATLGCGLAGPCSRVRAPELVIGRQHVNPRSRKRPGVESQAWREAFLRLDGAFLMQRVGVGIIGLGMAVKPHALALRDLTDQADVIGGYSPTLERRREFSRTYGLPAVESLDALMNDPRVHAVLILTPPRTHAELAL